MEKYSNKYILILFRDYLTTHSDGPTMNIIRKESIYPWYAELFTEEQAGYYFRTHGQKIISGLLEQTFDENVETIISRINQILETPSSP